MISLVTWLRNHKFESHLTAFLLMVFPSVGLYFTLQSKSSAPTWVLLSIFIAGNLLAMLIK